MILLFGAAGQVGQELTALARTRNVPLKGIIRAEADIADEGAVDAAVRAADPAILVNAAAYTAVDKAESEPDAAYAVNVTGARNIAASALRHGIPIIHLSTDYVFDGSKVGAYVETDPIAPLGVYGQTKAEGEQAIRETGASHVIMRTAWVYGRFGKNFLRTMLRLASTQDVLRVVADQRGCPTATADIAEGILAAGAALRSEHPRFFGTFHFAGTGVTTWHGLASAVIDAQAEYSGRHPSVEAIETKDYPTPARRPANSELDSSLFAGTFGYRARPWQDRVAEAVEILCRGNRVA